MKTVDGVFFWDKNDEKDYSERQFCKCGCLDGEFHKWGCSFEVCPFCFGSVAYCGCSSNKDNFKDLVKKEGRIKFLFLNSDICYRYGEVNPAMFIVPDQEWERVIPVHQRDAILCWNCFCLIRKFMENK